MASESEGKEERKEPKKEVEELKRDLEDLEAQINVYQSQLPKTPSEAIRGELSKKAEDVLNTAKMMHGYREIIKDLMQSGDSAILQLYVLNMLEQSRLQNLILLRKMLRDEEEEEKKKKTMAEELKAALSPIEERIKKLEKRIDNIYAKKKRKALEMKFKKIEEEIANLKSLIETKTATAESEEEKRFYSEVLDRIQSLEEKLTEREREIRDEKIERLEREIEELRKTLAHPPKPVDELIEEKLGEYERIKKRLSKLGLKEEQVIIKQGEKTTINWVPLVDRLLDILERYLSGGAQKEKAGEIPPPPPPPPAPAVNTEVVKVGAETPPKPVEASSAGEQGGAETGASEGGSGGAGEAGSAESGEGG